MAPSPSYDGLRRPFALRRHQAEALEAVDAARQQGRTRWWVTMPPGAGKTLVGTEVARTLGRRTVVFSPNTAVQGQWARTWDSYGTDAATRAGTSRDLHTCFSALTYQSLAVFDAESDEDAHLDRLHPNGLALIERMRTAGPLVVVLDECHHLLEVWGRLLRDVLAQLPDALVLGLTATPPAAMTRSQMELTADLFGPILYEARIPALVKEGVLAPYAELAWLVQPTAEEDDWLRRQSERFAELVADLFDPAFGAVPFPQWLERRFVAPVRDALLTWQVLATDHPEMTDAYLRLVHAEMAELPEGARLREPHEQDPSAADWITLLDDWVQGHVVPAGDDAVFEAVRRTLPSIGYVLTRNGIRSGRGSVDRVVARSAAKQQAVGAIVQQEYGDLGSDARVVVLCDHEQAAPVSNRRLRDGHAPPPEHAGSARGVLRALQDEGFEDALLVTGRTIAGAPAVLRALVDVVRGTDPDLAAQLVVAGGELSGPWRSGTWVHHATKLFDAGGTRCLVGTRGLLGEGWDAPCITTLVDLTTATTPTAVVQTRGRALRIDPARPEKVAHVGSVVCVSDQHVTGSNDWERFARKHVGYFTVDEHGEVVDGVAGIDSRFSPYRPPPVRDFPAIDAEMLVRAQDRQSVRDAWASGSGYADSVRHVLRVHPARQGSPSPVGTVTARQTWAERRHVPLPSLALAAPPALAAAAFLLSTAFLVELALGGAILVAGLLAVLARHGRERIAVAASEPATLAHAAYAVADALQATGRSPVGAEAVRVSTHADGTTAFDLGGAGEHASALFTEALEEVAAPMSDPRHVVPRPLTLPPAGPDVLRSLRVALGASTDDHESWHTVPAVLARRKADRAAFLAAWRHWVGGEELLAAESPQGAGVLATHRLEDPFAVTSVVRRVWS